MMCRLQPSYALLAFIIFTLSAITCAEAFRHNENIEGAIPIERAWTYKCENDSCVREHFDMRLEKPKKRVSYMTCAMTCGDLTILPQPTVKANTDNECVTFLVRDMQLELRVPQIQQQQMLQNAFSLFKQQLELLQRTATEQTMFNSSKIADINALTVVMTVLKPTGVRLHLDVDESYSLTSNLSNQTLQVHISGNSVFGARHGLASLFQLTWYDDESEMLRILQNVVIEDKPKFRYRGVMIDTARHYISVEAIEKTLRAMSLVKLNRFHWHLTDVESFPYVSEKYPQLAEYGAYSKFETYSIADISYISKLSHMLGIQIIMEIDPARTSNGWNFGPDFGFGDLDACTNQNSKLSYCKLPLCGQLKPNNNNTLLIMQQLYEELINATKMAKQTDIFHLGSGNINMECWLQPEQRESTNDDRKVWCDFMKQLYGKLVQANQNKPPKYVIVWFSMINDTNCLINVNFTAQIWQKHNSDDIERVLKTGYNIIFSNDWVLSLGSEDICPDNTEVTKSFVNWKRVYRHRPWENLKMCAHFERQILGGEVCIWTDRIEEAQLDNFLWPNTAAFAERIWSDPVKKSSDKLFDEFLRLSLFRERLLELNVHAAAIAPKYCSRNPYEC